MESASSADSWPLLKAEVRTAHGRMDGQVGSWMARHRQEKGRLYCGRGCSRCCTLVVNATFTEVLCVADSLDRTEHAALANFAERALVAARSASSLGQWLRAYRQSAGGCPLLAEDGSCSVYRQRPFSCRALLSTRPADWCAVDLASLHPLEQQAFLDSLERSVVAWPTHYAAFPQQIGQEAEAEAAWRMRETFGFSLTGNLPFLLWLEREFALSTLFPLGRGAVERLLEQRAPVPFLTELRP